MNGSWLTMFSVRIVSTDHYMSAPIRGLDVHYADQRSTEVKKVPVIRIFGSTPAGQKTCMHVHGVFPYLYIPYDGTVPLDRYLRQFATSLDKAINVALGHGQSNNQHVYKVVLVTGRAMYGYHDKEQQFLKIYFYSPSMIKKAADLLLGGAVLNKPFQPHEAHIPYTLQLFIDYNLYGMNMINVAAVKFRRSGEPVDEVIGGSQSSDEGFNSNLQSPQSTSFTALLNRSGSMTPSQQIWQLENIPSELYLEGVERLSTCTLEVDVVAADIINRLEVGANIGTNPGLAALWEDERQRCRERGETTEIAPPSSQERHDIESSESEVVLLERLQEILMSLQPYMDSQPESDSSQESEFPSLQASQLDLHLSQVDEDDSQGTVIVEDDEEDHEAVVNVESIKKVVSFSQSFSNVKPDLVKVSCDDKSLIDILASLADQNSPTSSQNAASDIVALEEQDSILSQLSHTKDDQLNNDDNNDDDDEILEMSQPIWHDDEKKKDDTVENYDISGMDDTWIDSQDDNVADVKSDDDKSDNNDENVIDDVDSDADSDIIPQFDGPMDEKVGRGRGDAKQALLKRLGMRGPPGIIHGNPRGGMNQYESRGHVQATNPFADEPSHSTGYNPSGMPPQYGNGRGWNPANQPWIRNMESNFGAGQPPGAMNTGIQPPARNYHSMQHSLSPGTPYGQSPGLPRSPYQSTNQYSPTARNQLNSATDSKAFNQAYGGSPFSSTSVGNQRSPTYGGKVLQSSSNQFSPQSEGAPFDPSLMQSFSGSTKGHQMRLGHLSRDDAREDSKHFDMASSQISPESYQRYQRQIHGSSMLSPTIEQSVEPISPHSETHNFPHARPPVCHSSHLLHTAGQSSQATVNQRLLEASKNVVHPQPGPSRFDTSQNRNQQLFHNPGSQHYQKSDPPNYRSSESRHNTQLSELSSVFARTNQMSALQTEKLPLANENSQSLSHDFVRANKMPPHQSSQNYASSVASSQDVGYNQPYQSNHLKNAQQSFTSMPLSVAQLNSAMTSSQYSVPGSLSVDSSNRDPLVDIKTVFPVVSCDSSCVVPPSSVSYSVASSVGNIQSGVDCQTVMSNILMQRLQKSDKPMVKKCGFSSDMFGSIAGDGEELNPLSGSFVPRTLSQFPSTQSLSSPSSTASPSYVKTSESFVGPVTKYFQKKLMYEQISPPATPSSNADDASMKSLFSPSPSSNASESHISPLQKLLLEPTNATTEKVEHDMASPDKGPMSNISSHSSEKTLSSAQGNLTSPGSGRNHDTSRLFNLLSAGKENSSRTEISSVKQNENLNSSQMDLFADSLISDVGSADNSNTADSLSSLFSDNVPVTPIAQTPGEVTADVYLNNSSLTSNQQKDNLPSLSSLENFVGSVRNESSEFGVNFHKTLMTNKISNNSDITGSDMNLSNFQSFDHRRLSLDISQNNVQNSVQNFNMPDMMQYAQPNAMPRISRGGPTRRRGRPSLKKSMSTPMETFGPVQKKRRGRPRKNPTPPVTMPPVSMSPVSMPIPTFYPPTAYQVPSHQYPPQFMSSPMTSPMNSPNFMPSQQESVFHQPSGSSSNNPAMNMHYYNRQQSFSELLEGDGSDLLAEFTSDPGVIDNNSQPDNQFDNNTIALPESQLSTEIFTAEPQNNDFNKPLNDNLNTENTSVVQETLSAQLLCNDLPNEASPCVNYETTAFPVHQELTTINLSEAINISEPPANFDTAYVLPKHPSSYDFEENDKLTASLDKTNEGFKHSLSKSFNRRNFLGPKSKNQKYGSLKVEEEPGPVDHSSIMELIRYRQRSTSPPKASPAYTFRFKVPSPLYKKIKFRVKNLPQTTEVNKEQFVRMHPKDARKYSLLKIGHEIIQLSNLSEELIDDIKNNLKDGVFVDGIPPPIRSVEIQQSSSIIADLLSVESPASEDMTEREKLDDVPISSTCSQVIDILKEPAYVMQKQLNEPLNKEVKDKKLNNVCRGRGIYIPHLKKYRAGFPYFGKGNVGRGRLPVKVRPNKKGLQPEYEDDGDVVLKDVSLNDASEGTLTPIKSRTPVAGRSPAHYVGNVADLDQSEKEILESKLYDLDLNQSASSQMFQDELFGSKDVQKPEFENANEDSNKDVDKVIKETDSAGLIKFESSNDKNSLGSDTSNNTVSDDLKPNTSSNESEMSDIIAENADVVVKLNDENKHEPVIAMKESSPIREFANEEMNIAYGKFKKHFERKLAMCRSMNAKANEQNPVEQLVEKTVESPVIKNADVNESASKTDESNSDSLNIVSNIHIADKESVTLNGEVKNNAENESVKAEPIVEERIVLKIDNFSKKRKQTSSNLSSGSRRKSRASSSENNKKSRTKSSNKKPRYDSDSDGIPGVDYIVTNRFKGHKELRVVVNKLNIDEDEEIKCVSVNSKTDTIETNHEETDSVVAKTGCEEINSVVLKDYGTDKPVKLLNGFSAEFEKFLASQVNNQSVPTDSDVEGCDNNDNEISKCDMDDDKDEEFFFDRSKKNLEDRTEKNLCVKKDLEVVNGTVSGDEPVSQDENSGKDLFTSCDASNQGHDDSNRLEDNEVEVKNEIKVLPRRFEAEGMLDFSSSSEDEIPVKQLNTRPKNLSGKSGKKKRTNKSIHDGSVFCSKARKRRPRPKSKSTKLMCTLSILHDATMEKLTSKSVVSDAELGTSSSNQSPVKSRDISDVDSPIRFQPRIKTPDFELYADKTDDHDTCYEDTMYKLAYLSPASSDKCSDSPPRPLSPKEMIKLDGTVEQVGEKSDHIEQRLTFADILKTMHGDVDSNTDTDGSKAADTNGPASKIAVAKTETLTLKDIKSLCQVEKDEESNDKKEEIDEEEKQMDSAPPDLGPPVLESSTNQEEFYDGSPPPQLTPNRSVNENCFDQAFKSDRGNSKTECNQSNPPFLVPCFSPRISTSPTKFLSSKGPEAEDISALDDNIHKKPEKENTIESNKKTPACCSSGSINVIHSEEFSDISESEDESITGRNNNDQFGKPKYTNSPTMPCLSPRLKLEMKGMFVDKEGDVEKQQKLMEIREFEERLKKSDLEKSRKSDENRNNIFELMSMPNSKAWNNIDDGISQHLTNQEYHDRDDLNHKVSNWKQIQGTNPGIIKFKERLKNSFNNVNDSYDGRFQWGSKSVTPPRNGDKDYEQSQSASKLLYDMSQNHTNSKHHGKNGEVEFPWPDRNTLNGDYKRSLSQNDYMLHLNRRHSSAEDLMNCSMELNYAALDRTENGKYSTNHRNFFNSFYSQQRSKTSQIGVNSGDLFESSSEISSVGCEKQFSTFHRSLSDSARTEYSIIRCNKLNDSIMKSVHNIANRQKPKVDFSHGYVNGVPFNELGSGDGKKGSNNKQSEDKRTNPKLGGGRSGFTPYGDHNVPDGFENRRGDNGHRHDMMYGSNNRDVCNVITPINGPPSLEKILQTANEHGLGAYRQTSAFYSNCRDMPEKPREGGGLLNSVQTTLVKDLNEFDSTVSSGIKHWRRILCTEDSVLSSQTGSSDLLDKLDEEPALKYAITGDQSVIITPCNLPPSFKTVENWNICRKVYQNAKIQAKQKEKENKNQSSDKSEENVSSKKVVEKCEENIKGKNQENIKDKSEVQDKIDDPDKYRLNLFTGKRELVSESAFTKIVDKDEHVLDNIVEGITVKNETQAMMSRKESGDGTNPDAQKRLEVDNLSQKSQETLSSPVSVSEKELDVLHSTPMLRRGSTELFEPDCTPISSTGKRLSESQEDATGSFLTPKRIKPLRRLSTNTDTQLRRALLTSQMKLQYGTPGLPRADSSQIDGPSLKNSFGFKHSQQNLQDAKALHEFQHLTVISVEVHAESRGDLKPDPEFDAVLAIFYSVLNDVNPNSGIRNETGVFIVDSASANKDDIIAFESSANQKDGNKKKQQSPKPGPSNAPDDLDEARRSKVTLLQKSGIQGLNVTYVTDENELFKSFIDFIHRWDPDIIVGYEIQMLSWGYLLHRAATININLSHAISRIPSARGSSYHSAEKDGYGADHMSEIHIAGRIVLNLWRLLRHEVTLNVYSLENVMFHVLHRRVPLFPFRNLTSWFNHRTHLHRWKVIDYYKTRVKANLELMDQLDIVGRTSEFARVFGIEFYHVLSRGSQYRVESMMLRVAKPMNYIPASPSVHQRARMKAPECIPLTLEPESRFYTDPVIVLDFQSLYPSIMIAYNYCFSTCLGRLEWFQKAHEGPITFGCTSLNLEPSVIQKLSDKVSVSPNGVVFCKESVKRGVLPVMVEEILNTRLMVKKAMSKYKGDKTLSRMLNARQLGLKLIANVTYGYTGANYSGRMPCVEVADSIVRKARETLERSIKLVENTPHWGARVVYGDTDSMFIELKGKSKDEAFKIGQDIAKTVTAMFPKPMKLKFEKVYLPCVLQTKKRYVGFMYETPEQKEPVYDAKGIETVRRDSCSAVSKILERSLKVLFTTKDVSQVKSYIQQQCQKILEGNVSLQDFIFAKEYRGMPGYKPGACVPALEIAKKQLRQDCRSEPRVGERVPYVIVYGSPGLPLIQLVRQPHELLQDPSLRLNSTYYINKQILPPLDRFLSLMGVNVFSWYQDIPHSTGRIVAHTAGPGQAKKGTISQYFATSNCPICDTQTKHPVCVNCMKDPQFVCVTLNERISKWEKVLENVHKICGTCVGTSEISTIKACQSLDCPVQFRRSRAQTDINKAEKYREILSKIFN
ncbi:DNA polymerase zeta catalytic subunit [Mactra antiquata]